jgi:carbonyl reductase 1
VRNARWMHTPVGFSVVAMTDSRIAVVTGATQGLGLAVTAGLAARLAPTDLVYLTGRDPDRIAQAVEGLGDTRTLVRGRLLDVAAPATIEEFAAELAQRHGGVDMVVSNAGARINPAQAPAAQVDALVGTNNVATVRVLRAVSPILRPGGRLLVVASSFGTLGHLDARLWPLFDNARSLTDIKAVLASWQDAVHAGTAEEAGWPSWPNVPSKIAQVAAVRVLAAQRRERDLADGTLIASVCPGLIDTDASRPWFADMSEAQTPQQAAAALLDLLLAVRVDPAHYGELLRFGAVLPWQGNATSESRRGVASHRFD